MIVPHLMFDGYWQIEVLIRGWVIAGVIKKQSRRVLG